MITMFCFKLCYLICFQSHCLQIFFILSRPQPILAMWVPFLFYLTMAFYLPLLLFNMFLVVASYYIHQSWQWCQVNNWILNNWFGIDIQSVCISNEFTDRVTKWWPLDSWLLKIHLYWEIDMCPPILTTMSRYLLNFNIEFKAFIGLMKSLADLLNFDSWILDCCEDVFIERQLCVHQFWWRCQCNHWILNTYFVTGFQIILYQQWSYQESY